MIYNGFVGFELLINDFGFRLAKVVEIVKTAMQH